MSLPPWTRFTLATVRDALTPEKLENMARISGKSLDEVRAVAEDLKNDVIFINSRYQVNVRLHKPIAGWPELIHLSIKRRDKDRVGPEHYRDFMRIKRELVGPEHEAVELYPADSREVDSSNQYHLWVIKDKRKFPFGFEERFVSNDTSGTGARQHPREE